MKAGEKTPFLHVPLCILFNDDINISVPPTSPKVAMGFLHFFRYVDLQGEEKGLKVDSNEKLGGSGRRQKLSFSLAFVAIECCLKFEHVISL
jgi:hypothetical protein